MDPKEMMNTKDHTADFDPADIEANKAMGIISYLGFLCLIPLFTKKDSAYAQFHAKQGLNLFILEIVFSIVMSVLTFVFAMIKLPIIGMLVSMILSLVLLVLFIIGLINAFGGKAKELPIIGGIKIIK